jgi:hypothetical protein
LGREISYRAGGRGRDGSQGQGQGGQGRGSRDNKPKTYNGSSKALEMKFIMHGIGKEVWQTATYQTVKDYIRAVTIKNIVLQYIVIIRFGKYDVLYLLAVITIKNTMIVPQAWIFSANDPSATTQNNYQGGILF